MADIKQWRGQVPAACDLCGVKIIDRFVDGRTLSGQWANMCLPCARIYGSGLGTGRGQSYERSELGPWLKVSG